jgi:two-component system nitrate/nitrite response regulator NarL
MSDPLAKLSKREREIVEHVLRGDTLKVVAGKLGISFHTVNAQMKRVYKKLGVHSRVELIITIRGLKPKQYVEVGEVQKIGIGDPVWP